MWQNFLAVFKKPAVKVGVGVASGILVGWLLARFVTHRKPIVIGKDAMHGKDAAGIDNMLANAKARRTAREQAAKAEKEAKATPPKQEGEQKAS